MNPSIFRPKQLVENFVEKITRARGAGSLLTPAKNAAPVKMMPISLVFSSTYERLPRANWIEMALPRQGPKCAINGASFAQE
jgi:hypothetical protein